MNQTTPIKTTLAALQIGGKAQFPNSRRGSVRTTASNLKTDFGLIFETKKDGSNIIVERKK